MNCKTDGAVYEIEVHPTFVICKVYLPADFTKDDTRIFRLGITELKQRIHDGMENALMPLFPQY